MDHFFLVDSELYCLYFYGVFGGSDGEVGLGEASALLEVVQGWVSSGSQGDVSFPSLIVVPI